MVQRATMNPELSAFVFHSDEAALDEQSDFVAHVPAGVRNRNELFEVLQRELRLPDYFGRNWDALSECLRDLSWILQRRVAIIHEGVPQLEAKELSAYLEVLVECVRDWKGDAQHELIIVFEKEARAAIEDIVTRRQP